MPAQRGAPAPRPGDMTALRKQTLEAERDKRQAEENSEAAAAAASEETRKRTEVIDFSGAKQPLPEVVPDEAESTDPYRTIRIKSGIEDMVFGREILDPGDPSEGIPPQLGGLRMFTFEEGRLYRVPVAMAKHLDERGYVFH